MNWIANFVRPRIKGLMRSATADNLWRKCTGCGEMVFHRDLVAAQSVCRLPVMIAVQSFEFMGGSLGLATGAALVAAMSAAVTEKRPFILIVSSGGARMQEGILSLMQMPRTTVGVNMLNEAGIPYIVVLTDPTTGGVSASYAMLGDVQIAEPGALIGFSGPRVIEQTIRERLPEGFQRAEYLLDHGMIDMIVHRHQMKETLSRIVRLLTKRAAAGLNGNGRGNGQDRYATSALPQSPPA